MVVVVVVVAVVGNLVQVGDVGGEISGGDGRRDTVVESTVAAISPKQFEHAAALQGGRGRKGKGGFRPMDLT